MKKKILSILLIVCMLVGLLPTVAFAETTVTDVTYYDWNNKTKQLEQTTCTSATVVTSGSAVQWGTSGTTTWYVAQGNVTIKNGVTVNGDVHLILMDGYSLTVQNGIKGNNGNLTVYAQSTGDNQGRIQATGVDEDGNIESRGISVYEMTINGGIVTVTGSGVTYGYGISAQKVTMNGGIVEATGIGAIYGYGIFAQKVTMNGGIVEATGSGATYGYGIFAYEMTINGGIVTATSSSTTDISFGMDVDNVTINGGIVTATGSSTTGISYGIFADNSIAINGGHVTVRTLAETIDRVALNKAPTLDAYTGYYWRTGTEDSFTLSTSKAYSYSGKETYVEFSNGYTYTITLNPNCEGSTSSTVITGTDGKLTTGNLPVPTREGYTFDGWFTAAQDGIAVTDATVFHRDSTIYAHWTANQYTITYQGMDDATHRENHPEIHTFGTETVISNPTRTGYTFNGWKVNGGETPVQDLILGANGYTDAITLTAQWTINQYTITFDTDGGGEIDPITQDYGTEVTAPENPPKKEGYTFEGWAPAIPSTMPAEDITVKAQWTANSTGGSGSSGSSSSGGGFSGTYNYPVRVDSTSSNGATVTLDKTNAVAGDKVTITVTPDAGKAVDEVIVTDADGKAIAVTKTGDNQYTFTMPAGKVNIAVTTKAADYQNKIVLQIGNRNILENNKTITNDVAPIIVDNRTMVPIRVITEILGGTAHWNADTQTVTLNIDGRTLTMTIGQTISGFDTAPIIRNDRTYVPVRYVAEMLGASVEWVGTMQQIIITK